MSNFQFLESHWTDLAKLGDLSEKYVYSDPNTSIIKQGMLSEVMVKYMLAYDGIAEPAYDNTHANRIRILNICQKKAKMYQELFQSYQQQYAVLVQLEKLD